MASWSARFLFLLAAAVGLAAPGGKVSAQTPDPVLDYVPNIGTTAELDLSGDGRWAVWVVGGPPRLFLRDLQTGDQSIIDLRTALGDASLNMPNPLQPSISDDGSRIVLLSNNGGFYPNDLLLVLDRAGTVLARVIALDRWGNGAVFDDFAYIDGSGEFVTFSIGAYTVRSSLPDGSGGFTNAGFLRLSDDFSNVVRLELSTGELLRVSSADNGNEPNNHSYANGVSKGGRFVIFNSGASNLPDANGNPQVYVRDMSLDGPGATVQVSVDPNGNTLDRFVRCGFYCSNVRISDDGAVAVLGGEDALGARGLVVWRRDGPESFLTQFDDSAQVVMSGNGRWLSTSNGRWSNIRRETLIRHELATGNEDPPPSDITNWTRISDDGRVVLFSNPDLAIPDGNFGNWWRLTFPDTEPPPIEVLVEEPVAVMDGVSVLAAIQATVFETITVSDVVTPLAPLLVEVSEVISVIDSASPLAALLVEVREEVRVDDTVNIEAPIELVVLETITVSDLVTPLAPLLVEVSEVIAVTDSASPLAALLVDVREEIRVADAVTAQAPIEVKVLETIIVSDVVTPLAPLLVEVSEVISVDDALTPMRGILVSIAESVVVGDTLSSNQALGATIDETVRVADVVTVQRKTPPVPIALAAPDGLFPGAVFTALAEGFRPGTIVRAWLLSEPLFVGEAIADEDGRVSIEIRIPADFPPGAHTLVLEGTGADGNPLRLTREVHVASASDRGREAIPVPTLGAPGLWMLIMLMLAVAWHGNTRGELRIR